MLQRWSYQAVDRTAVPQPTGSASLGGGTAGSGGSNHVLSDEVHLDFGASYQGGGGLPDSRA